MAKSLSVQYEKRYILASDLRYAVMGERRARRMRLTVELRLKPCSRKVEQADRARGRYRS
jgi:hypothetical protein